LAAKRSIADWNGTQVAPGQSRDLKIEVGESYSGQTVSIPLHLRRGRRPGPVVFVTAALHGDEINGSGAIRELIGDPTLQVAAGALILVPVLNVLAFERHARYLPDRRDLNRCFPGAKAGSLASRYARAVFDEIVARSDFGIDLHTAAVRRTNYPTVRADLSQPPVRRLARAFGGELILDSRGPKGSLRRAASDAGCPTIVLEGGEVWKVEPSVVRCANLGIRRVLAALKMTRAASDKLSTRLVVDHTRWVRAERGGFLWFHVGPGDVVDKGQPLATNTSLLGREKNVLTAPYGGIVIGMTTLPAVRPGEPVCHLGRIGRAARAALDRKRGDPARDAEQQRLRADLAKSILVVAPPDVD